MLVELELVMLRYSVGFQDPNLAIHTSSRRLRAPRLQPSVAALPLVRSQHSIMALYQSHEPLGVSAKGRQASAATVLTC